MFKIFALIALIFAPQIVEAQFFWGAQSCPWCGAQGSGAPTSRACSYVTETYARTNGMLYMCTVVGNPGTWASVGSVYTAGLGISIVGDEISVNAAEAPLLDADNAMVGNNQMNVRYVSRSCTNNGTGTTIYYAAKRDSSFQCQTATSLSGLTAFEGIVQGNAGTTGAALVAFSGLAQCTFDNATTAGNYVSVASDGRCHDNGSTSTDAIGVAASTNGSAGTYYVRLKLATEASGSGGLEVSAPYLKNGSTYYLPGTMQVATRPNALSFSWVNQGSATITEYNGALELAVPGNGGNNIRKRVKSLPGGANNIVTAVAFNGPGTNGSSFGGVFCAESATGKARGIFVRYKNSTPPTALVSFSSWNGDGTYDTSVEESAIPSSTVFLRVDANSGATSCAYYYSMDSRDWVLLRDDVLSFTADQWGFGVSSGADNSSAPARLQVLSAVENP